MIEYNEINKKDIIQCIIIILFFFYYSFFNNYIILDQIGPHTIFEPWTVTPESWQTLICLEKPGFS